MSIINGMHLFFHSSYLKENNKNKRKVKEERNTCYEVKRHGTSENKNKALEKQTCECLTACSKNTNEALSTVQHVNNPLI